MTKLGRGSRSKSGGKAAVDEDTDEGLVCMLVAV